MPLQPLKKDLTRSLVPTPQALPRGIVLKMIDPLFLSPARLNYYKEAKKNAFMAYHSSLTAAEKVIFAPENYYAAFTATIAKFKATPTTCYMVSATDEHTKQVLGGLLSEKKNLSLSEKSEPHAVYIINYLFVEPTAQHQGIGTALVTFFINRLKKIPCVLAVRSTHAVARRLYEKCGFQLVTDPAHPDGRGTPLVHALLEGPGYTPQDFVAYSYTR